MIYNERFGHDLLWAIGVLLLKCIDHTQEIWLRCNSLETTASKLLRKQASSVPEYSTIGQNLSLSRTCNNASRTRITKSHVLTLLDIVQSSIFSD